MTRSEYIRRAKEAIAVGVSDKRWGYAAEHGDFPLDGQDCGLCDLDYILADENEDVPRNYDFCPVQYVVGVDDECGDEPGRCCREWLRWCDHEKRTNPAKAAAKAMIVRLLSLDVEGCADAMVKDGILEAD